MFVELGARTETVKICFRTSSCLVEASFEKDPIHGLDAQTSRIMGQEDGKLSSFDLLCPDVMDIIVEKVTHDDPRSLAQLAKVNKAFLEAEHRRRQVLVIHWPQKQASQKPARAMIVRRILSKQLSERPKVSKLILTGRAPASLLTALSRRQWKSAIIGACSTDLSEVQCAQRLSGANSSLRSLVLTSNTLRLYKDVRCIVETFPNLEDLTLKGQYYIDHQMSRSFLVRQSIQPGNIHGNLKRLDVSHLSYPGTSSYADQLLPLLESLKNLEDLKMLICEYNLPNLTVDYFTFLPSGLQCLHLELFTHVLNDVALQSVAKQCPALEELVIFVGIPPDPRFTPDSAAFLDVFSVLNKCPNLERLFISRTKRASHFHWPPHCRRISVERVRSLDDLFIENPLKVVNLREFSIFLASISCLERIDQNAPNIRDGVVGEAAAVQSWCKTFCQAEVGRNQSNEGEAIRI